MAAFLHLMITLGAIAFPFVAMVVLWRRMKKVRERSYRGSEQTTNAPEWEESLASAEGLELRRRHAPNDDLIALGSKGTQSRWPLDNQ